jgi:tRNA dimethylallyltransferase
MIVPAERVAAAKVVLIAGPTASGKSRLALALAMAADRPAIIVNADSMQVYDGLGILTARPSDADMQGIPHRLFGHVAPATRYSAGAWLSDVGPVLASAEASGALPIIVGGTGLYFHALEGGLASMPRIPPALRAELSTWLREEGPDALRRRLEAADPAGAANIRPGDTQRMLRALEVVEATGRPLASWQEAGDRRAIVDPATALRLVLAPDRAELYRRIDARFDAMLGEGALDEVRALRAQQLDPALPAMRAIGVRELAAHLAGSLPLADAAAAAKAASRHYAKRQETWFRNQMPDWERLPT